MDISLLHAGLAAGAALAALPVILHLFMKQTPKHLIFPALRLIRERQKKSKKRLKVKNWLLLLARMMLLALMALALARPTLNSETALGDQEVPTALALVFDTSLSMQYTEKGNDRLKEAKLRAAEILKRTTEDSEVFVVDSAGSVNLMAVSPGSALKQIDGLKLRAANRPLNAPVVQASAAVAASNLGRREVYVLTDLASSAWDLGSTRTTQELEALRKGKKAVKTYILKLTPKEVRNVAVVAAEPASSVAAEGEPMEIRVTIRSTGPATTRVAEFTLDGEKNKKGEKAVDLPANGEREISFLTPPRLETGLHQGRIKLGGGVDFMAFDDVRYFSFNVDKPLKVLLVADRVDGQDVDDFFVKNALAPTRSAAMSRPPRRTGWSARPPASSGTGPGSRPRITPASSCSTSTGSTPRIGPGSRPTSARGAAWSSPPATAPSRRATPGRSPRRSSRPPWTTRSRPLPGPPSARPNTTTRCSTATPNSSGPS